MKSLWISIFLCVGAAAYGQGGFDYNAIHGGISKDKVGESKLQWGAEVNGVKAALEIGPLMAADGTPATSAAANGVGNSTVIPLLFHVKNGSDKTYYTGIDVPFGGVQFYTAGGDGKLVIVKDPDPRVAYMGSGVVVSIKPGEVLTIKSGFPVAWVNQLQGGLIVGVGLNDKDRPVGEIFSQAVKIESAMLQKQALTLMDIIDPPYTLADLRIPNDKIGTIVRTADTAVLVSFFPNGDMRMETYVTIRRDGKRGEKMFSPMDYFGKTDKSPVGAPMPEAQRVPLYAALNSLPESQPPKDDANAFLVSWDDGGKWTTRIYDRTHLPPEASGLVKVMGIPETWL